MRNLWIGLGIGLGIGAFIMRNRGAELRANLSETAFYIVIIGGVFVALLLVGKVLNWWHTVEELAERKERERQERRRGHP